MKVPWTEDMGEISGFGGGYEQACRDMLDAGLTWLEEHPDADPQFEQYENIYGICTGENDDAKALSAAATAVTDDCTGAMHQAVVNHCMWINNHSLEEWIKVKREREAENEGGKDDDRE